MLPKMPVDACLAPRPLGRLLPLDRDAPADFCLPLPFPLPPFFFISTSSQTN
jgi:hypothetical protein